MRYEALTLAVTGFEPSSAWRRAQDIDSSHQESLLMKPGDDAAFWSNARFTTQR